MELFSKNYFRCTDDMKTDCSQSPEKIGNWFQSFLFIWYQDFNFLSFFFIIILIYLRSFCQEIIFPIGFYLQAAVMGDNLSHHIKTWNDIYKILVYLFWLRTSTNLKTMFTHSRKHWLSIPEQVKGGNVIVYLTKSQRQLLTPFYWPPTHSKITLLITRFKLRVCVFVCVFVCLFV